MWAIILSDVELQVQFKDILQIVKIVLVLPVHTAAVERGFSQMNLITNDKRNNMSSATLRSVLHIKLSKQDFRTYDPTGAIVRWAPISAVKRRRTTPYKQRPQKITKPSEDPQQDPQQEDTLEIEDDGDGMVIDDDDDDDVEDVDDEPDMMVGDDEAWKSDDEESKSEEEMFWIDEYPVFLNTILCFQCCLLTYII